MPPRGVGGKRLSHREMDRVALAADAVEGDPWDLAPIGGGEA